MNRVLLTLISPPSLERPITDWLLEQDVISGFTSSQAYGHGSEPDSLTLIEQVEGRKKQFMFQIHIPSDFQDVVIEDLKQNFKETKKHFLVVPLVTSGRLT